MIVYIKILALVELSLRVDCQQRAWAVGAFYGDEKMSDFDFVDHYGTEVEETGGDLLPENAAPQHLVVIPDSDGVGKDVNFGKKVLKDNSTVVEDALRTRLGKVDWLFVLAGGGGGTGSAASALKGAFERYLKSVQASGTTVYVATIPTAQESLNDTISANANSLLKDISNLPHIALSNEKQVQMLRGKVGMLNLYPAANTAFAKMLAQVLKLASETSPIQTFDSKDLEKCFHEIQKV